jgi:hypothetical protein
MTILNGLMVHLKYEYICARLIWFSFLGIGAGLAWRLFFSFLFSYLCAILVHGKQSCVTF